jgi:LAS superfamily LD-carboxypeptidase LdcB
VRDVWPYLVAVVVVLVLISQKVYGYSNGQRFELELTPIGNGQSLRADAAAAYLDMQGAAALAGIALVADSGFRSMSKQIELYNLFLGGAGNQAAAPGYSNHQGGIAVDIAVGGSFTSPTYLWLAAHAGRWRWVNAGRNFKQPEPWHWEFQA